MLDSSLHREVSNMGPLEQQHQPAPLAVALAHDLHPPHPHSLDPTRPHPLSFTIDKQNDVTIDGEETTSAELSPPRVLSWPVPPADASQGDVYLEPWTSRTLTPGTYGRASVKQGARLTLEPGVYRISALEALEPGSVLDAQHGRALTGHVPGRC